MDTVIIGTRGSALALYQANEVKARLEKQFPEKTIEIKIIKTKGDKILDVALSKIGDKGLFTKELEVELLAGSIHLAVHSLKDLPTTLPEGLSIGATLERAEVRDALVSRDNMKLSDLTPEHKIATSSLRRKAQLLKYNPDFQIIDIRGNVNTRLRKLDEGYCDAMIMAGAGLLRLDMKDRISELIEPDVILPAASQGAIAVEIDENNEAIKVILESINHTETQLTTDAERVFLKTLEGGCQVPIGCYSTVKGEQILIQGYLSHTDGDQVIEESIEGNLSDAKDLAFELATRFINRDAKSILREIRLNNQI